MTASIDNPPSAITPGELDGVSVPSPPANAKALIAVQFAESAGFSGASFTVSLDSQAPTSEHLTLQQTGLGCGVAAFVWNKTALDAMTLPANISYTDGMVIGSGGYLLLWIVQDTQEASPVREAAIYDNAANADIPSMTASGTTAVAGDLPLVFGINISASRDFVGVLGDANTLAAGEVINTATTVGWGYGSPKASAGSWSAGLTYDTSNTADASLLALLVKGDAAGGTTYTQVVKDSFAVTAAQPGQVVAGLRPGDRVELMADSQRIAYRGVVRADDVVLTDQAIPTTFDIPVTRFRTLVDGFRQCWDFTELEATFALDQTLLDVSTLTDAIARRLSLRMVTVDAFDLADAFVARYRRTRRATDVFTLSDALIAQRLFTFVQSLTDVVRTYDNVIATYISGGVPATVYNKLLIQGVDVFDDVQVATYLLTGETLSDAVAATDAITRRFLAKRVITEPVTVRDTLDTPGAPQITVDVEGSTIIIHVEDFEIELDVRQAGAG